MKKNYIIILKNDAVGDLVQSLNAINNIINHNKETKIIIYLSERSKNFDFLLKFENVKIKILNYNLSIIEKIKIIYTLLTGSFRSIYILTPKNFYFYLPIIFRRIKFYGLCMNDNNSYKRPSNSLRKYLYKYVINERDTINKRKSTMEIQVDLTKDLNFNQNYKINLVPEFNNDEYKKISNYIYFHLKFENFKKLGWGIKELNILFDEFLKYKKKIIFTRDIDINNSNIEYKKYFNVINFYTNESFDQNSEITLFYGIKGSDLYNVIRKADKVVAFHGMMTNLATIEKRPVLDLFYCDIKSLADYRRYKNALYEFKPVYKDYDFIVPSKNITKTINKMKFSFNKSKNV